MRVLHICYCALIEPKFGKADKNYKCSDTRCKYKEAHILCPIRFGYKLDYATGFNQRRNKKQHICLLGLDF